MEFNPLDLGYAGPTREEALAGFKRMVIPHCRGRVQRGPCLTNTAEQVELAQRILDSDFEIVESN